MTATTQAPTLVVGDRHARCSTCGESAWPVKIAHTTSPHGIKGCGIAYTAVTVEHGATDQVVNTARTIAIRLDLPYQWRWPDDPQRGSAGRDLLGVVGLVVFIGLALWLCGNWAAL